MRRASQVVVAFITAGTTDALGAVADDIRWIRRVDIYLLPGRGKEKVAPDDGP